MSRFPKATRPPRERVLVVGVRISERDGDEFEEDLTEACGLAAAAEAEVVGERRRAAGDRVDLVGEVQLLHAFRAGVARDRELLRGGLRALRAAVDDGRDLETAVPAHGGDVAVGGHPARPEARNSQLVPCLGQGENAS